MDGDNNDQHPGPNGNKFNVDDLLLSLMRSSTSTSNPEDLTDMSSIDGEYSALNNTIDELNRFLDVWDARHDQLRSEIKEALEEAAETESPDSSSEEVQEASATEVTSEESSPESKTDKSSTECPPSCDLDAS